MMRILSESAEAVEAAADVLRGGGVVITPTRTNYSVICDPYNDRAVERIFRIKRRTKFGPLTLGIAIPDDADPYVRYPDPEAQYLIKGLWPSCLSAILPKVAPLPERMTMGAPSLSVLCHESCALSSIAAAFGPVALTSANLSGQGDIHVTAPKARADLGGEVDLMIEAPPDHPVALQSNTIIDLSFGVPYLVREGAFPASRLREAFPDLVHDPTAYELALEDRRAAAAGR